jgi:hypothetical protein
MEVVKFTPQPLYPRGKMSAVPTRWVNPRAGLDALKKRNDFLLAMNRTQAVQSAGRHYTDWE